MVFPMPRFGFRTWSLTAILALLTMSVAVGEETRAPDVIVGVYRDVGVGASVRDLLRAIRNVESVYVREVSADDILRGCLSDVDVLIHPGGSGGKQGRHLGEEGRQRIRQFVQEGGGFMGICAGAYLASADYGWSL